jgi:TM2 domain-containing membrane protein YozV
MSDHKIPYVALLCLLSGALGAHRFHVGKVGTGLVQLATLGGAGLWVLADLVLILGGAFKDAEGRPIKQWA